MNLTVLDLSFSFGEKEDHLYPVLLQYDQEAILVDCGYAGFVPLLEKALQKQGVSLNNLTGLLITHHDIDHMGGAYELKEACSDIKIYTYVGEGAYVSGREKSLRLQQAEDLFEGLPEEQKPGALAFQELLKSMRHVQVDAEFTDNEEPAVLPGVQVLHTPGHMPGHISLYVKESKTLVAADALVYQNGELEIANPSFTLDLPRAIASIKRLQQLDINRIVCYHGGVVESDIQLKLRQLLARYS